MTAKRDSDGKAKSPKRLKLSKKTVRDLRPKAAEKVKAAGWPLRHSAYGGC